MKKLSTSALLLAVLLLPAVWIGCDSAGDPVDPTPTPNPTGNLSGVVREAGTDIPVSDVSVELGSAKTMTDQNGLFEFREVQAGLSTSIRTRAKDFEDHSEQIVVQAGDNSIDISLLRAFVLRFDHTPMLVGNLEENATFYEDILRLKTLESPWGPNSTVRYFSTGGDPQVHLEQDIVPPMHKQLHIAFSVQDFDAVLNSLNAEGVEYASFSGSNGSIQTRPDGVRQVYFEDPHGNWLEINDAQASTQTFDPKFDHIGILARDLDESERFYKDILRLKRLKSPFPPGGRGHFFLSMGGNHELHVVQEGGELFIPYKARHLAFSVQYFENYLYFLTEKGVEYGNFSREVGQFDTRPDGVREIYLQDPYGNWIEINDARY